MIEENGLRDRDELDRDKIGNDRSIGTTGGKQLDQALVIFRQTMIAVVVMIGVLGVAMRMV